MLDPRNSRESQIVHVECRWSEWSSCSYYCGDPKVETSSKALVEVVPKGSAALCEIPQRPCGEDIQCTSKVDYQTIIDLQ